MKIEITTNGEFKDIIENGEFDAKMTYSTQADIYADCPYFEIWEIEKSDMKDIWAACALENVWMYHTKGANRGTPFEPLTINGQFVIGWTANNNKNTFNCLTNYFMDGLGVEDANEMCDCATTMAKTNGWSLTQLWSKLEG